MISPTSYIGTLVRYSGVGMSNTFIVPIKKMKEGDLLIHGLLDVKKYSKNKTIFSVDDRILCYFVDENVLFGPIYVSNDKVQRYEGDINNLQIECTIKEKVYCIDYEGTEDLRIIDTPTYESIMGPHIPEETPCPPSVTGDYELDGVLCMVDEYRGKHVISLSSTMLIDYVASKMDALGMHCFEVRKKDIVIKDTNLVDRLMSIDISDYLSNSCFYKGLILPFINVIEFPEVGAIDDKYNKRATIFEAAMELGLGGIDNTLFPIVKDRGGFVLSGMCRHIEPFDLLFSELNPLKDDVIPKKVNEKCQIPDNIRYDLSMILVKRMLHINGYDIYETEDIADCCSRLHLERKGTRARLIVIRTYLDIPADYIEKMLLDDSILVLHHDGQLPFFVRGVDYLEARNQGDYQTLESKRTNLMYESLYLNLNWVKSEFSNQIFSIWDS